MANGSVRSPGARRRYYFSTPYHDSEDFATMKECKAYAEEYAWGKFAEEALTGVRP